MADPQQLERVREGVTEWNEWRTTHTDEPVDLSSADLSKADLTAANLAKTNLAGANLSSANLTTADLSFADVSECDLTKADLTEAYLWGASLIASNLNGATLVKASLGRAILHEASFVGANLRGADLRWANFLEAGLSEANLAGADLEGATLVGTILRNADLSGCNVYGISAWDVDLEGAKQTALLITPPGIAEITVDNLEVAQFIYLLLNNENVRRVIDTITSKVVLVLGRFTDERKAVLDALRSTLRTKNYSPVVFDFEKPASRNLTETIRVLAGMARFVIADITDAKSIPQELMAIVPDLPSVPVQPLLLSTQDEYGMFESFQPYPWVLEVGSYDAPQQLVTNIDSLAIRPAEKWLARMGTAQPVASKKRSTGRPKSRR